MSSKISAIDFLLDVNSNNLEDEDQLQQFIVDQVKEMREQLDMLEGD